MFFTLCLLLNTDGRVEVDLGYGFSFRFYFVLRVFSAYFWYVCIISPTLKFTMRQTREQTGFICLYRNNFFLPLLSFSLLRSLSSLFFYSVLILSQKESKKRTAKHLVLFLLKSVANKLKKKNNSFLLLTDCGKLQDQILHFLLRHASSLSYMGK